MVLNIIRAFEVIKWCLLHITIVWRHQYFVESKYAVADKFMEHKQ